MGAARGFWDAIPAISAYQRLDDPGARISEYERMLASASAGNRGDMFAANYLYKDGLAPTAADYTRRRSLEEQRRRDELRRQMLGQRDVLAGESSEDVALKKEQLG